MLHRGCFSRPYVEHYNSIRMKRVLMMGLVLASCGALAQSTLDGPDAPDILAQPGLGAITVNLVNPATSNNFQENYAEVDPSVTAGDGTFHFQGYKVYQVADATVSATELLNSNRARLIGQSDIQDSVDVLVNFSFTPTLNQCLGHMVVEGANTGLEHSLSFTHDAFSANPILVNEEYCFMAVAYAHNGYFADPNCNVGSAPYLEGKQSATGAIQAQCIIYSGTTSIDELPQVQSMRMAPNPANDNVRIELNSVPKGAQLTVYDLTGKIIATQSATAINQLDLSDWHAGLYFVKLTQPNGNALTQKLLVN